MKLTKNFDLNEFTYSKTAVERGINNYPQAYEQGSLKNLCVNLLQPLRDALGESISINSGYRCKQLNDAVGGSKTSQHMRGEAADCAIKGNAADLLDLLIKLNISFDQALLYKSKNFLHLSLKREGTNRRQIIKYK